MSYYVFDNAREPGPDRLSCLERPCDPTTISRLQTLRVTAGWSCLEIGGGNGSIAAWLSERVGDGGAVVVIDIEPRFLEGLAREKRNASGRKPT